MVAIAERKTVKAKNRVALSDLVYEQIDGKAVYY